MSSINRFFTTPHARRTSRMLCHALLLAALPSPYWAAETAPATTAPESLESKWGAAVSSTRLSAGGYMIDFRYKVLDPVKAAPLAKRENKAYLIDQATGAKFLVPTTPKVGALRQNPRQLEAGKIYFMFFANPGNYLKAGSKVTVVIGDYRVENLVVE
jgi:hypothetical protein